ncbi:sensor histidine kinase [Streptomyces wuyuanensis]|uniref:Signal transduction histidine kinase n=1 Tax=Streptomyces wuyuanensis TaxID=1196353 RepID=A0A1G9YRN8_9ACTN|nr:ATP-binding protein [Streptomyces wuyuanensis]SDN11163.1 Signal transduction histidine kinase [Streptomyces wuyuanensis]
MSVGSGLQRAQSFMVLATGLYRASHLVVAVLAVVQHQRDSPLSWAGLAVAVSTSLLVFGTARSKGWFGTWPPLVDVVLVGCLLPFLVYAGGAHRPADIAWSMLLGGSASAAAAVAFPRPAVVAGAVVALVATHTAGYWPTGADVAVIAAHLNAIVSSAVLARVFWWYLRRQGSLLDAATAQALAAEAERARYAERIAHHRALHDTVLATLTAIASGRADADAPPVRERCAREAAYLRRLVLQQQADEDRAPGTAGAIERAVRSAESLGLRVNAQYDGLAEVPAPAAAALGDAVTEALNNVLRHAGTSRAHVTVTGGAGRVVVTVVDRGVGFDPRDVPEGLGLRFSVGARMRESGGAADVDSAPGEGTRIELRWPA